MKNSSVILSNALKDHRNLLKGRTGSEIIHNKRKLALEKLFEKETDKGEQVIITIGRKTIQENNEGTKLT